MNAWLHYSIVRLKQRHFSVQAVSPLTSTSNFLGFSCWMLPVDVTHLESILSLVWSGSTAAAFLFVTASLRDTWQHFVQLERLMGVWAQRKEQSWNLQPETQTVVPKLCNKTVRYLSTQLWHKDGWLIICVLHCKVNREESQGYSRWPELRRNICRNWKCSNFSARRFAWCKKIKSQSTCLLNFYTLWNLMLTSFVTLIHL